MLQLLWEKVWQFLKKLNLELLYDPKILLSGVYPKEFKVQIYTKELYSTAHSSIISKKWKQSEFLSSNEWINKIRYSHTIEYYSTIKRLKY